MTKFFLDSALANHNMKLWLLEILACPIDHAFPLALTVLKWQGETPNEKTGEDQIAQLLENLKSQTLIAPGEESPVEIGMKDGQLFIHDSLIIKPTLFSDYLEELITKIDELSVVKDKSSWAGETALKLIQGELKSKLLQAKEEFLAIPDEADPITAARTVYETVQSELEFLNLFKYYLEIEDGVMVCPKCNRWFPIFETIPQMLPDGVRNAEKDDHFKNQWNEVFQFP